LYQVAGFCDCGNEPSASIKRREFSSLAGELSFSRRALFS
jgi:hypothetical protein